MLRSFIVTSLSSFRKTPPAQRGRSSGREESSPCRHRSGDTSDPDGDINIAELWLDCHRRRNGVSSANGHLRCSRRRADALVPGWYRGRQPPRRPRHFFRLSGTFTSGLPRSDPRHCLGAGVHRPPASPLDEAAQEDRHEEELRGWQAARRAARRCPEEGVRVLARALMETEVTALGCGTGVSNGCKTGCAGSGAVGSLTPEAACAGGQAEASSRRREHCAATNSRLARARLASASSKRSCGPSCCLSSP
jgi:hypothetical protein